MNALRYPLATLAAVTCVPLLLAAPARAQAATDPAIEQRLQRLEERQEQTDRELKAKDDRIRELEQQLHAAKGPVVPPAEPATTGAPAAPAAPVAASVAAASPPGTSANPALPAPKGGAYEPASGFVLARGELGELDFGLYTYLRYLNQNGLDDTYTDSFGRTRSIDRRNDLELNKLQLNFKGWFLDPKFRYRMWAWSANTSQGDPAQVVLGGTLDYMYSTEFTFGGGIFALPSTRSTQGSFPNWYKVDHRTMADEFFRGSYTTGIWMAGKLADQLKYKLMLANNLSQLGVSALQMDGSFNTFSAAAWWMPTTGEYGPNEGFGDFEMHDQVATLLGLHFTRSREDRQAQPGTDDPENTQLRLSDGTGIFQPNAFNNGTTINKASYRMIAADAGVKYRGFALDGEFYWRKLDNFAADGPLPVNDVTDTGFQVQASAMLMPRTLQVYVSGSKIYGDYGDPSDFSVGVNWWPYEKPNLRGNIQVLYLNNSPSGYAAVPFVLGGNGTVLTTDIELRF